MFKTTEIKKEVKKENKKDTKKTNKANNIIGYLILDKNKTLFQGDEFVNYNLNEQYRVSIHKYSLIDSGCFTTTFVWNINGDYKIKLYNVVYEKYVEVDPLDFIQDIYKALKDDPNNTFNVHKVKIKGVNDVRPNKE